MILEHKIGCFVLVSMAFSCKSRCVRIVYIYRELFRVAVTVPSRGNRAVYGRQWDNYPNDFNILKNRISLIINLPKKNMSPIKKHMFLSKINYGLS